MRCNENRNATGAVETSDAGFGLEIRGLSKRYGSFAAVDGFDMEVLKGETMGLLGPNGAGKSTILKCVSGLQFPTDGTISIDGVDFRRHKEAMARVGCVIETPMPYPVCTPAEMLSFVGRMRGIPKDEIRVRSKDVMETLGIWPWRDKRTAGFSKGMRQRVTIATALMHDPDVVLLDEPASGLDPRGMMDMRQIIAGLKKKGTTMVISTHMLREAYDLCDSVTIIDHGKKVAGGSVKDVVKGFLQKTTLTIKTDKDVTAAFLKKVAALPGVSETEAVDSRTLRLGFDGTDAERTAIAGLIQTEGLGLLSMDESYDGLERLYMSLTGNQEAEVRCLS